MSIDHAARGEPIERVPQPLLDGDAAHDRAGARGFDQLALAGVHHDVDDARRVVAFGEKDHIRRLQRVDSSRAQELLVRVARNVDAGSPVGQVDES